MKYFKNAELTRLYNVSDKAVRNWIESSRNNKIKLELFEFSGKYYVADTLQNSFVLQNLVEQGRKFRNKRSHRSLNPNDSFYETYSRDQILDIANQLDIYGELPIKYKYFGNGAGYWDQYLEKLHKAGSGNLLTNTIEAIDSNLVYLKATTDRFKNVNIINICVGNSLAARNITKHFADNGKLRRFALVDASHSMLDLSEKKVRDWLPNKIVVEKHVRDLDHEYFYDVLTRDSFRDDASETINIILFLAGPIVNFKEPEQALRTIRESMGKDDILITSLKRDTEQWRRFFDFNIESDKNLLNYHSRHLLELLNIDATLYDIEQKFDERRMLRLIYICPKLDLSITFAVENYSKAVHLKKGQKILLFRSWHHSDQDIINKFTSIEFNLLQITKSLDNQLILLITNRNTYRY